MYMSKDTTQTQANRDLWLYTRVKMEYGNTQQYYQQQYKPRCGEEYMYEKERIVYEGAPAPKHQNPTNNNFKRNELLGEASAVATGAFALVHQISLSTNFVLLLLNKITFSFVFLY